VRLRREGGPGQGPRALSSVRRARRPQGARGAGHLQQLRLARPALARPLPEPRRALLRHSQRLPGHGQRDAHAGDVPGADHRLESEDLGGLLMRSTTAVVTGAPWLVTAALLLSASLAEAQPGSAA